MNNPSCLIRCVLARCLVATISLCSISQLAAQAARSGIPTLRFSGFPPPGSAGRGGGGLDDIQQTALTRMDEAAESQIAALGVARRALVDATFAEPGNAATIQAAVDAVARAEEALALVRADGFARLQASANRLPASAMPLILQAAATWSPPAATPVVAVADGSAGRGGPLAELNRVTGTIDTPEYTVRNVTLLDDFKMELLFVTPTSMGSWVGTTLDDRGRLIVASHNSNQIFRISLPRIGSTDRVALESVDQDIGFSQGILYAFNSLYVMVGDEQRPDRRTSGLYRLRDTNGDDSYDQVRVVRNLRGWGQHGTHGGMRVSPDGSSIFLVNGNATVTTDFATSHIPYDWGEDTLVRRVGTDSPAAPEAWVAKMDPDGTSWELWSIGMRNPVDIAFNKDGELFTYDADMEFDKGHPFYRPTNVAHLISGADMHFRNDGGTRKRPGYDIDAWEPVVYLGSGSPTGIVFGTGARFPAKYQDALFLSDWSYGNVYAVHMKPNGSSYSAEAELFASGQPFGVADLVVNPADGALYAIVGGNSQSALYRITYTGSASTMPTTPDTIGAAAREQRRRLEQFHGRVDPTAVNVVWDSLGSSDRGIRYAARIALEFQDPSLWRERALNETDPRRSIAAIVALARVSGRDDYHRTADDPAPDKALQSRMIAALGRVDWDGLDYRDRLDLLRAYSLVFTRLGPPDSETAGRLISKFDPLLPGAYREINWELAEMLIYLEAPSAATKVMALLRTAPSFNYFPRPTQYLNPLLLPRGTPGAVRGGNENVQLAKQEDQIQYAHLLRNLKVGWTTELREEYLRWFLMANEQYSGGNSFKSHLGNMRNEAVASLTDAEREALSDVLSIPYEFQAGGFGGGGPGGGPGRGGAPGGGRGGGGPGRGGAPQ